LTSPDIVYIVAVHNEAAILEGTVRSLANRLPGVASRVILVENGSRDDSLEIARKTARDRANPSFEVEHIPTAGIGYALDRGLEIGLASSKPDTWFVLTAADLPFGYSDLDQFLPYLSRSRAPSRFFIGSKAHRESRGTNRGLRSVGSLAYRVARRLVAGMKTGDSQGTMFLRADLAAVLRPLVYSRDFFYSTELVFLAERLGEPVIEMPVVLEEEQRPSTVKLFRNGVTMLRQLVELRQRPLPFRAS
jgi:glycosyltransferase involved in cell wall biosynthesis